MNDGKGKRGFWARLRRRLFSPAVVDNVLGGLVVLILASIVGMLFTLHAAVAELRVANEFNRTLIEQNQVLIQRIDERLDGFIAIQASQGAELKNLKERVASNEANP